MSVVRMYDKLLLWTFQPRVVRNWDSFIEIWVFILTYSGEALSYQLIRVPDPLALSPWFKTLSPSIRIVIIHIMSCHDSNSLMMDEAEERFEPRYHIKRILPYK